MSTTAVRSRRRRKAPATTKIGKEAWQVVNAEGHVLALRDGKTTSDGAVLNMAQRIAERHDGEIELFVRLVPLFGDPDVFYRVVRAEDGTVLTWRA